MNSQKSKVEVNTILDLLALANGLEKIESKIIIPYEDDEVSFNTTVYIDKKGNKLYMDNLGFHNESQIRSKTEQELEEIGKKLSIKRKEITSMFKDILKSPKVRIINMFLNNKSLSDSEKIEHIRTYMKYHGK